MKAKQHHTKKLRKLINTWAPLVRSELEPNQTLHHSAHLSALITTILSGRYPL